MNRHCYSLTSGPVSRGDPCPTTLRDNKVWVCVTLGEELHKENRTSKTLWTQITSRTMSQEGTYPSVNDSTKICTGYVGIDHAVGYTDHIGLWSQGKLNPYTCQHSVPPRRPISCNRDTSYIVLCTLTLTQCTFKLHGIGILSFTGRKLFMQSWNLLRYRTLSPSP